jgi:hypothetical protein
MSLNDRLKEAIDRVDPDRRLAELKASAGELAREHGGRVEEVLEKVEATLDTRTKGAYADRLATAHRKVTEGLARVAAQPPLDEPSGGAPRAELPPHED